EEAQQAAPEAGDGQRRGGARQRGRTVLPRAWRCRRGRPGRRPRAVVLGHWPLPRSGLPRGPRGCGGRGRNAGLPRGGLGGRRRGPAWLALAGGRPEAAGVVPLVLVLVVVMLGLGQRAEQVPLGAVVVDREEVLYRRGVEVLHEELVPDVGGVLPAVTG